MWKGQRREMQVKRSVKRDVGLAGDEIINNIVLLQLSGELYRSRSSS